MFWAAQIELRDTDIWSLNESGTIAFRFLSLQFSTFVNDVQLRWRAWIVENNKRWPSNTIFNASDTRNWWFSVPNSINQRFNFYIFDHPKYINSLAGLCFISQFYLFSYHNRSIWEMKMKKIKNNKWLIYSSFNELTLNFLLKTSFR